MGQAKRKQQRDCPAKGTTITPEECGRGRNSTIDCPVDCVFNPFNPANHHEQFRPLEFKVIDHLCRRLAGELTPAQMREIVSAAGEEGSIDFHALQVWHIHGSDRLRRWKEQGLDRGWKNDERVMLRCLETLRPALLEFHEVRDDLSCVAVDLLRPELPPFTLLDSVAAARVGRFDVMVGWLYEVPAGQRLNGVAFPLPGLAGEPPVAAFRKLLDHLGCPPGDPAAWLFENMALVAEASTAIERARRDQQIRMSDLREFTLRFPLPADRLETIHLQLKDHSRVWVESPSSMSLLEEGVDRERDPQARVLGSLHRAGSAIEFVAMGAGNAEAGRSFLESIGLSANDAEERVENLAPSSGARAYNPDLVPPEFLAEIGALDLRTMLALSDRASPPEHLYHGFADLPVPLLDGKTPREAAVDPGLRPRLVEVMKKHVSSCDQRRRSRGEDFDLNPLLAELGLDELIFPPPPLGWSADEEADEEIFPLDPPPAQAVLAGDELHQRIDRITVDEALWNRLEIRLADMLDGFNDLSEKLNASELQLLQTCTLLALGALHPEVPDGYDPDADRMVERFETWLTSGDPEEPLGDYLDRIFAETRQPELCEEAVDLLLHFEKESGKKLRKKKLDVLFTALAAAIWEAAHWPPALR